MVSTIIQTKNLSKQFGKGSKAVNNLDMNVPEGVVYGLLGRNGAGKTTTLRMFMSLLKPTSGEISVMGSNPWNMDRKIREQIGYASDSMRVVPWMKIGEVINYNGAFYPDWDHSYVEKWVKRLELPLDKRVFSLSRGNRQKLALILAIGHKPKLLILDEPAGGLDPLARKEFLENMIELIHESGTTIILSSHLLSDLERIADYIGLIDNGKMKVEMSLEDLKNKTRSVTVISNEEKNIAISGLIKSSRSLNTINYTFSEWNEQKKQQLLRIYPDSDIEINSLSLEDIFLSYI